MSGGVAGFVRYLRAMTASEIRSRVAEREARRTEPGDDVAWWTATAAVDRALRRDGSLRAAASASRAASDAVFVAAADGGVEIDEGVRALARSAADAARALAAGVPNGGEGSYLLAGWETTSPCLARREAA